MPPVTITGANSASYDALNAKTGLTYVASANIPAGSAAGGYLESVANAATSFKIEATGSACNADGDEYWATFYLQGVLSTDATGLPAGTNTTCLTIGTGATEILLTMSQTDNVYCPGFGFSLPNSQIGTTAKANAGFIQAQRRRDLTTTETQMAWWDGVAGHNWYKITIHIVRSSTVGRFEVFINGMKVIEALVLDMNTNITWAGGGGQALTINLPAWTGAYWRVCGPITTVATATTIGLRPDFTQEDTTNAYVTKWFEPFGVTSTNYTDGVAFQSSGNSVSTVHSFTNSTDVEYLSSGGQTPFRRRLKMTNLDSSGATVGSPAPVVTSIDNIGALPYNEHGWATVAFTDLLVPSGATLNIQLRNVANDANVVLVQITGGSLFVAGTNICPWTVTNRYALLLHLHSDGRAAYTLINLTASLLTTKTVFSATLTDWTPASLGKLIYSGVPSGPGGGNTATEIGICAICKWATISGVDSLSSSTITPASGSVVTIRTSTSVARRFPYGEERQMIPGGYYPMKELGLERRLVICPTGMSGLTRRDWQQFSYSGFDESHGLEFLFVDGGSINDVFAPLASTAVATAVVANLKGSLAKLLEQCAVNRNRVWIATMLQRTLQSAITGSANDGGNLKLTTGTAHGLNTNNYVTITGSTNTGINGTQYAIVTIADTTHVTLNVAYSATSDGTITATLSTAQEAARTSFNTWIRSLVTQKQSGNLFTLSDIDADQTANAGSYPTSLSFWADSTHPLDTTTGAFIYIGAGYVAKRMLQLRTTPPNPRPLRRLSS